MNQQISEEDEEEESERSEVDLNKPKEKPVEKTVEKIFLKANLAKKEEDEHNEDLGLEEEEDIEEMKRIREARALE